ncbi:MAG: imidazole glycerol phosphate synthase subunit HisF [Candidatus Thorarchaeota archaeon]
MPLTKRIIPCLDVKDGYVVKGIQFIDLKGAGNAVDLANHYNTEGADELVFLDITASSERRKILIDLVEMTSNEVFIPLTVGGGLRTIEDIKEILRAGADKVSLNTAAVQNPKLISNGAKIFGSQSIVTAIDAKRIYVKSADDRENHVVEKIGDRYCWWQVYIHGGRTPTGKDAILWGEEVVNLGSGEILLTSMDFDGTKNGYDIELTRAFSEHLNVPIIASGGAGTPEHIIKVFKSGRADAALAASIFHYNEYSINTIKSECQKVGIPMRF